MEHLHINLLQKSPYLAWWRARVCVVRNIKLLAQESQLKMETGGNDNRLGEKQQEEEPGSPAANLPRGSAGLEKWLPQAHHLQSPGCQPLRAVRQDTLQPGCLTKGLHPAHCFCEAPEPSPPAAPTATALLAPRWPLFSAYTRPRWCI